MSDRSSRGERPDASGPALADAVRALGWTAAAARVVADERSAIAAAIRDLARGADLVLTTGGTGCSPRDRTPEATRDCLEREIPGIPEELRRRSAERDPRGLLSRGACGILPGGTLVLNLPGSPGGAVECLRWAAPALPHAAKVARGSAPGGAPPDCGGGFTRPGEA